MISPEIAANMEYDAILVCNLSSKEIYKQCIQLGIDLAKVIFLYNNCSLVDMNQDYGFIESILGLDYAEVIRNRYHMARDVEAYGDLFLKNGYMKELCGGIWKMTTFV